LPHRREHPFVTVGPAHPRSRRGVTKMARWTRRIAGADWGLLGNHLVRSRAMKGDKQVIQYLNRILTNELTAVNQYFLHARMLDNWGMEKLGKYEYKESIDEMRHADRLVKRILFLDGLPNLQDLDKIWIGENIEELLRCDLKLEEIAIPLLREAIAHCESVKDYVTRELLEDILESEEEHVDFIETQIGLIAQMGVQNYVQLQTPSANEGDKD
jgi:bacterioferritin